MRPDWHAGVLAQRKPNRLTRVWRAKRPGMNGRGLWTMSEPPGSTRVFAAR